ncbi:hypothetical protein EBZ39_10415 [bacterium]|nr:hypothetical protein [bacterium]
MSEVSNYDYNRGYQDAMNDIIRMLHEERISSDGHGDPLAVWWSRYWSFGEKIHELWRKRFVR